jgi:hypothetical protein
VSNPKALADIRSTAPNSMARVASARQLELMRTGAEQESPGFRQSAPGLVVIIENRDGSVRTIAPPMPAHPMIEVDPLPERAELEPPA